ncbi:MAG: zf-HC2 domain-containing protein [Elusimicrobia bacterium]|nr:zf-HC2 domain-containing protein [Elusimicrobiota bacterium]
MSCKYSEYISGWYDGELNSEQKEFYQKHLEQCPVCRAEKQKIESAANVLKTLRSGDTPEFNRNFSLSAEAARRLRISEVYENIYYKMFLTVAMLAFMLRLEAFEPDLNAAFIIYAAVHIYLYMSDLKFKRKFTMSLAV